MNPKHPLSTITVYRLVASFILAISIYSCANMSRPGGGPRDETPPVFIKSTPVPNALNVSKQKVEIEFDEIIQVDKPSEKVIVSPPQKDMPEIRTSGRKITVILKDSLLPNTTYTIDFSDAIIDNNERNPLYGFAYSFSTGPKIDSLQVSGILLNARDLEPITGMLVGLHSDLEDSAFQKLPLERIASSDELGHFTIRNVTPGKYRLFALKDMNRDYRFVAQAETAEFRARRLGHSRTLVPQRHAAILDKRLAHLQHGYTFIHGRIFPYRHVKTIVSLQRYAQIHHEKSQSAQEKRKKERQGQRLHRSSRNPIHANERQDKLFSRCL